jgi:hypothetical protein
VSRKKERIDSNVNVDPSQRKAKLRKMSAAQHDLRRVRVLLGSGRHERVDDVVTQYQYLARIDGGRAERCIATLTADAK